MWVICDAKFTSWYIWVWPFTSPGGYDTRLASLKIFGLFLASNLHLNSAIESPCQVNDKPWANSGQDDPHFWLQGVAISSICHVAYHSKVFFISNNNELPFSLCVPHHFSYGVMIALTARLLVTIDVVIRKAVTFILFDLLRIICCIFGINYSMYPKKQFCSAGVKKWNLQIQKIVFS